MRQLDVATWLKFRCDMNCAVFLEVIMFATKTWAGIAHCSKHMFNIV